MFIDEHEYSVIGYEIILSMYNGRGGVGEDSELDNKYDPVVLCNALARCVERGFIVGFAIDKNALGNYFAQVTGDVSITQEGLAYIKKL